MIEPDLRLRAVVPAPPKTVYKALTDPAALRVWLAEHADVDLPGKYEFWGRFTPDGAEPHQRVLHADERTIRFAWTVDGVESTVQFELAEDEGGTLVEVKMTLTAPGCGMGPVLQQDVQNKLLSIEGVDDVNVELVWEPQWNHGMLTEAAKLQLGLM